MLALKGKYPENELAELPEGFKLEAVSRLQVPFLARQRHVVEILRV
jgi:16S rRNA (guanine527-N7)-methyltransferase